MQDRSWEGSASSRASFHPFPSTIRAARADSVSMHAWIFRHRKRLSAVFGMVTGESWEFRCDEEQRAAVRERPVTPAPRCNNRLGIPPGELARRGRYVVLAPMARRRRP